MKFSLEGKVYKPEFNVPEQLLSIGETIVIEIEVTAIEETFIRVTFPKGSFKIINIERCILRSNFGEGATKWDVIFYLERISNIKQ